MNELAVNIFENSRLKKTPLLFKIGRMFYVNIYCLPITIYMHFFHRKNVLWRFNFSIKIFLPTQILLMNCQEFHICQAIAYYILIYTANHRLTSPLESPPFVKTTTSFISLLLIMLLFCLYLDYNLYDIVCQA
jgi:hypothetical protein